MFKHKITNKYGKYIRWVTIYPMRLYLLPSPFPFLYSAKSWKARKTRVIFITSINTLCFISTIHLYTDDSSPQDEAQDELKTKKLSLNPPLVVFYKKWD